MSENSQILQTTVDDLDRISQLTVGNTASKLRIGLDMAQRRILILQQTLMDLRANESVVKGRIYNNYEQTYIEQNLAAGKNTKVESQNSFDVENISPTPNPAISAITFKIYNEEGNRKLKSELDKINNDIQVVLSELKSYEATEKLLNLKIKSAENQKSKQQTLLEKTTGKVYPPTLTDLELDKVRKSAYANVSLLYNLSKTYLDLSVNSDDLRFFSDDAVLPPKLAVMRQVFWATVQQFPNYVSGTTDAEGTKIPPLNTTDPGALENLKILRQDLDNLRIVGKDEKTDQATAKYVRDLKSISTDQSVSRGIERKPDPTLPDSNSMNAQTKTYSVTAARLGNFYIGSFELPSLGATVSKWWKKKNKDLCIGLPLCPNVQKPPETSTDQKEENADIASAALQKSGAEAFQKALDAASAYQVSLLGLPTDAPDWVVSWTKLYKAGTMGTIGQTVIVRTFAGTLESAARQAKNRVTLNYGIETEPYETYYYAEENKSTSSSTGNISPTWIYFAGWALS